MSYFSFTMMNEVLKRFGFEVVKGGHNPNDKYVYKNELFKPWILIHVSSQSVGKWENGKHLNI